MNQKQTPSNHKVQPHKQCLRMFYLKSLSRVEFSLRKHRFNSSLLSNYVLCRANLTILAFPWHLFRVKHFATCHPVIPKQGREVIWACRPRSLLDKQTHHWEWADIWKNWNLLFEEVVNKKCRGVPQCRKHSTSDGTTSKAGSTVSANRTPSIFASAFCREFCIRIPGIWSRPSGVFRSHCGTHRRCRSCRQLWQVRSMTRG